jgi:nitrite reductase/ring-hydroxylating ferredoxin subunit
MTFLCLTSDIPEGQARGFEFDNENIIAVKLDGQIYTYINKCPHLGIPLNWEPDDFMDIDGDFIRCSTHGALFLVDKGDCVSGPCSGQSLQSKPHYIKDNRVFLSKTKP